MEQSEFIAMPNAEQREHIHDAYGRWYWEAMNLCKDGEMEIIPELIDWLNMRMEYLKSLNKTLEASKR